MSDLDSAAQMGAETAEATIEPDVIETPETDETDAEAGATGEEQEIVEEVEFDFGGNKLKVPKGAIPEEIAAELDKFTKGTWSDYTKRSQAIAERAKSIEAREAAAEKIVSLNGEALQTYSRGLQIRQELEQLSQIDMNVLWQSNPDQARHVSDLRAQKQAEFNSIVQKVSHHETELTKAQQAELARRSEEGRQVAERMIKGFNEKAPEVMDYVVKEYGLSPEEAATWPLNPKTAVMAYKAMQYDRMQAKAGKPQKAPQAQPVPPMKATGAGTAQQAPANMTPAQMAKYLGLPSGRR